MHRARSQPTRRACVSLLEPRADQLEVAVRDARGARGLGDAAAVPRENALDVATLELLHDALARAREREVVFDDGGEEVEAAVLRLFRAIGLTELTERVARDD